MLCLNIAGEALQEMLYLAFELKLILHNMYYEAPEGFCQRAIAQGMLRNEQFTGRRYSRAMAYKGQF